MATNNKKNQQKSELGKFAGMSGVIFKSEVDAALPAKGIVGKGMPRTCNASISEAMSARSLRQYKAELAAANGDAVNPDDFADELSDDDEADEAISA